MAMDMVDPQPTLVELLVSHVLLPREFLPQIEINSDPSETATVRLWVVYLSSADNCLAPKTG